MEAKKSGLWRRIKAAFFRQVSDRRKYPRVPISVKVTNLESGSFSYYLALNISVGGMFLKADESLPVNTPVRLQFTMPEHGQVEIQGVVVRFQKAQPELGLPSGMGIKFTTMLAPAKQSIDTFMEMKV